MGAERYLVCGCTPWARDVYERVLSKLPGEWRYVDGPGQLQMLVGGGVPRRFAFFLHWRWKVPKGVLEYTECVGLHIGELPQERGGTPLQWRILGGQKRACVSLFRMTEEVDAGPVHAVAWIDLDGPAELGYRRAMEEGARLIRSLVEWPTVCDPEPQYGEPKVYPRRTPEQSRLPDLIEGLPHGVAGDDLTLAQVYDRIRCVDAPGYPPAYLLHGGFRYEFRRAVHYGDRVVADVTITAAEGGEG